MQDSVAGLGAALRPHFKTHRTSAIAQMQLDAGAIGLTVATVRQLAAVREELGALSLVSSLLQADAAVSASLHAASGDGLMFTIESPRSVQLLRAALGPELRADVMIEVEAGCQRSGADPSECAGLARTAANLGFDVVGLLQLSGPLLHSGPIAARPASRSATRSSERPRAWSGQASAAAHQRRLDAVDALRAAGRSDRIPPRHLCVRRPPAALPWSRAALPARPDGGGTVVAVHGDRVVSDAGGKAFGRDAPRWLTGFGHLADELRGRDHAPL